MITVGAEADDGHSRGDSDSSREGLARIPLLATKLHVPPVRLNLVSRPHLLSSLTPGSDNRLILLSAPAGFGKTTLLSDWLTTHPWPTGWLSLDRGDNDPARFWTYVISALQTIRPGLGESALALAHLRTNGSLLELRVDKLRFTRAETSDLLNVRMKLGLSAGAPWTMTLNRSRHFSRAPTASY
jgi:ATP/maltotriose-dependent transcriptional regulator MalT